MRTYPIRPLLTQKPKILFGWIGETLFEICDVTPSFQKIEESPPLRVPKDSCRAKKQKLKIFWET